MPRFRPTARQRELLIRPPWVEEPTRRQLPAINIIDQLEELAVMLRRGLLSRDDFNRQKRKVLAR